MEESAYGTRVEEAANCCGLPLEAARFSAWDQFPLPRSCQEEDLLVALALKLKSRAHGTSLRAVTPTPLACKGRGSRDPRRAPSLLAKTDVRLAPSWILEQGLTRQASSELSGGKPCIAKGCCCWAAAAPKATLACAIGRANVCAISKISEKPRLSVLERQDTMMTHNSIRSQGLISH